MPTAPRQPVLRSLTTLALCLAAAGAQATVVSDAANDFLTSFTGVHSPDLDVRSVSATFDGTAFHIGATVGANVGTLSSALYVWGFDRGRGATTSSFAGLGLPGVMFDAVITMTGTGVLGGRDLVAGRAITLPAGSAHISGDSFVIDVPLSALLSQGFDPLHYGINLWPRDSASVRPAGATNNDFQIADFAPNATNFSVPEPGALSLLLAGGLAAAAATRQRRRPPAG